MDILEKNEVVQFKDNEFVLDVSVSPKEETVWLNRRQTAELFDRDIKAIGKHLKNIFEEGELDKNDLVANFATTANDGKTYQVEYYKLDVIISVGYHVKSKRSILFRKWANKILKSYFYEECIQFIRETMFIDKGDQFVIEKDESFHSSIATIYQSFGGQDLYPTIEDKASTLLYFIVKNYSFIDGNKRIGATVFLYFLSKNKALYKNERERISNDALAH